MVVVVVVVVKGARAKRSTRDRRAEERQQEGRESGGCGCAPGFDHGVWDVWLLVMMEVMRREMSERQTKNGRLPWTMAFPAAFSSCDNACL